ncbi:MAG: hypothetical protein ACRENP_15740 [Longimicrobiales bacterium]
MPHRGKQRFVILALIAALGEWAYITPTAAQARTLDTGTRVRVRMERQSSRFTGSIVALRPDTIILTSPSTRIGQRPVVVSKIVELEVYNGSRRLTAVGLLTGVLAGAALTDVYNRIVQSQCFSNCPDRASTGMGALVGGIVVGGSLHFVKRERWLRIAVPGTQPR